MRSLSALVLVSSSCLTLACSLDTEQFTYANAGGSSAAGSSGSSAGTTGTAGTSTGGGSGGSASGGGGNAGSEAGGSGGAGAAGAEGGGAGAGAGGDAGAAGASGAGAAGAGGVAGEAGAAGAGGVVDTSCTAEIDGARRCAGDSVEKCENLAWVVDGAPCQFGCVKKGITASCKPCAAGVAQCDGNKLDICAADGLGFDPAQTLVCGETAGAIETPVCDAVGGACKQCAPGDKVCQNGFVKTCSDSGVYPLSNTEDCGGVALCKDGACLGAGVCKPGDFTCSGAQIQYCKADQSGYADAVDCAKGSSCFQGVGCAQCNSPDGTTSCQGDTLVSCKANQETVIAVCAAGGCDAVAGKCLSCDIDTFQCVGQELSKCDGTKFGSPTTCPVGTTCDAVLGQCSECATGSARCSTDDLQLCVAGKYEKPITCKAGLCDAAGKECDECVTGEASCAGAERFLCNAQGQFERVDTCASAALCDTTNGGRCVTPTCQPGETRCSAGRQPQICNADLTGFVDAGPACSGACIDFKGDSEHGCVGIVGLSSGASSSCAILGEKDRRLACWGRSPTSGAATTPTNIPDLRDVDQVEIGANFACVLSAGVVKCWGQNDKGQLAREPDKLDSSAVPLPIDLGPNTAVSIAIAGRGVCALTNSGVAMCWGALVPAPATNWTATPTKFGSGYGVLGAGGPTRCGLESKDGGSGYCWGSDERGKLGNSAPIAPSGNLTDPGTPIVTAAPTGGLGGGPGTVITTPLLNLGRIAVGGGHVCALTAASGTGSLYCWGDNGVGQLGTGAIDGLPHAEAISVSKAFAGITVGEAHSCGYGGKGAVSCWGRGNLGQNGSSVSLSTPTAVAGLPPSSGATVLDAGDNHTCGLFQDGSVFCWGTNDFLQLGKTLPAGTFSATPVQVFMP